MFIVTKGEPRLAFFIPGTPEHEALKRGKIVFAFTKMGRAEQVFEFDYNLTGHGNIVRRMQEMTEQTDDILRNEPRCVYDHELVRAEATNIELCKEHVTREDWLQVGWLKEQDWPKEAAKTAVDAFAVVWNFPLLPSRASLKH